MAHGVNEAVIHSPISAQREYSYRSGAGIIPSAEYAVYFNDFFEAPSSNAIPGTTAVIDTSATVLAGGYNAVGYTGALRFTSNAQADEGSLLYWPKNIQLGLNKKFFMETKIRVTDADDCVAQFGLSAVTAATNPEDLWTTTSAELIAFGVLKGDATVTMLCDKGNSGSAAELGSIDLSDGTWHVLAIEVGGSAASSTMFVKGYVDGQLALTWSTETTIPDSAALAPFLGYLTGTGTGDVMYADYIRWSLQR